MSGAAAKRPPATVALDLRLAGRVAAAAVDGRGALAAWTVIAEAGAPADLARRALRELRVRPREVRVLLGAGEAQAALLSQAEPPAAGEIGEALFAEGYERLREPAVAALPLAPGTWLVAAAAGAALEPLADALLAEGGVEPRFVVDQMLAVDELAAGTAAAEYGEAGLLIAAKPAGGPAFVRSLPPGLEPEEAASECRESLDAAGFSGPVQVLGSRREALSRRLAEGGLAAGAPPPPAWPEGCEPARRLAARPGVVPLSSPRGERRRASLAWALRAGRAALVLALVGALAMAAGLRLTWKNRTPGPRAEGEAGLARELRQMAALAGEAKRLRGELAPWTAPWPRLAPTVAALARELPPGAAWERLEIKDGALELEAAASAGTASPGGAAGDPLALLRRSLEGTPGLVNVSWAAPDPSRGPGPRQLFRATLAGAAPKGAR